jgi:hypothetical protein
MGRIGLVDPPAPDWPSVVVAEALPLPCVPDVDPSDVAVPDVPSAVEGVPPVVVVAGVLPGVVD